MSVTDEVTIEEALVDFDPQVVAVLVEQSQGKYHKILLSQDDAGTAFFRETTNFVDDESDEPVIFGPFADAASALWGISLL